MKTILQLNSSIFSDDGQSSKLANEFVQALRTHDPDAELIVRDLAREPVPHLSAAGFKAFVTPAAQRTAAQQAMVDYSDALIDELKQADVVVLGLPMYNFGVPSILKAYFDHIARAGVTFKYTENGPIGLLENKKVYIVAARGGVYQGTPRDTQTHYVSNFLNFIGISDIEFLYAEGLNMGTSKQQAALSNARNEIQRLAA